MIIDSMLRYWTEESGSEWEIIRFLRSCSVIDATDSIRPSVLLSFFLLLLFLIFLRNGSLNYLYKQLTVVPIGIVRIAMQWMAPPRHATSPTHLPTHPSIHPPTGDLASPNNCSLQRRLSDWRWHRRPVHRRRPCGEHVRPHSETLRLVSMRTLSHVAH